MCKYINGSARSATDEVWHMKNKEKREIYFFSRLAKLINEDAEDAV